VVGNKGGVCSLLRMCAGFCLGVKGLTGDDAGGFQMVGGVFRQTLTNPLLIVRVAGSDGRAME